MATVDKNFKVKHGLIVEGTTATVNGEDILTTASTTSDLGEGTNLYFTDQRAIDAVSSSVSTAVSTAIDAIDTDAIEEGVSNLYFTNQRALDATSSAYDAAGAASSAQTAAQSYADGLAINYDAAGAAATAESNANSYTDTAVSNLVNGAPALLDTLNELAAAINDDASFATTVATQIGEKQDTLTAGTAINIDASTDTISVKVKPNAAIQVNASNEIFLQAGDGLVESPMTGTLSVGRGTGVTLENEGTAIAVDTTVIASVSYVDTNFVNVADLPGQLDDYVPVTEKGAALGVATLDASGYVPASQLNIDVSGDITTAINALTTSDIEEGTNLYFTNTRAVDALEAVVPNFTAVELNSISKQIAATATVTAATSASVYSFRVSDYKVAKFLVKVSDGSNVEVSEVLLAVDSSDNISITEYGNVASNASLSSISASYVGGSFISLDVTPVSNGTVKVFGTLIV